VKPDSAGARAVGGGDPRLCGPVHHSSSHYTRLTTALLISRVWNYHIPSCRGVDLYLCI